MVRLLLGLLVINSSTNLALAQSSKCPTQYSEEQTNVTKHSAWIGAAGTYCPNLERIAEPLYGYLAKAWGSFPSAEVECPIWKTTYKHAEDAAGHQIAAFGLKAFCERSIRNYGPTGELLKGALNFHIE